MYIYILWDSIITFENHKYYIELIYIQRPKRGLWKWFTCVIIGLLTGVCMAILTICIRLFHKLLFDDIFPTFLAKSFIQGYIFYLLFAVGCALCAGLAVWIEPRAAGSGIEM